MYIALPVITAIVCLLSFLLMLKDSDNTIKACKGEDETAPLPDRLLPLSGYIYSGVCIVITVLIAVFFPRIYSQNSIWVNVKRMTLLAIIWPVAYIDLKTLRIPNLFILEGLICRGIILCFEFLLGHENIWSLLLTEVIAAAALLLASLLCILVVKNGIGFGDMKLFVVMGLLLGLDGIWGAIFMALIVSFFIALYVLITKKKTRKDAIPFGPALVIGTYLSICLSGM